MAEADPAARRSLAPSVRVLGEGTKGKLGDVQDERTEVPLKD